MTRTAAYRLASTALGALALALVVWALVTPALAQQQAPDCTTGSAVQDAADNPGLVADCEALLGMKDELRGSATLNWSPTLTMKRWTGVALGGSPSRVTKVKLHRRELTGQIPAALGSLEMLEELWLYVNKLTGTIPPELGNLANLRWLFVSTNELGGQIPAELNNLSLDRLWLYQNDFTGCVPYNLTLTREYQADRTLPACEPPVSATPNSHTHAYRYAHTRVHTHAYRYAYTRVHTHAYRYAHTRVHARAYRYAYTRVHARARCAANRLRLGRSGHVQRRAGGRLRVPLGHEGRTPRPARTLNWSADVPIKRWTGVALGGSPGRVTKGQAPQKGG